MNPLALWRKPVFLSTFACKLPLHDSYKTIPVPKPFSTWNSRKQPWYVPPQCRDTTLHCREEQVLKKGRKGEKEREVLTRFRDQYAFCEADNIVKLRCEGIVTRLSGFEDCVQDDEHNVMLYLENSKRYLEFSVVAIDN
jgi:hypothetical protein